MAKRRSYTVGYKLKAVVLAEDTSNGSAGKALGINKKLLRDWRKKKVDLKLPKGR